MWPFSLFKKKTPVTPVSRPSSAKVTPPCGPPPAPAKKPTKKVVNKKALDSARFTNYRGSGINQEVFDSALDQWYALADIVDYVTGPLSTAHPAAICDSSGWSVPAPSSYDSAPSPSPSNYDSSPSYSPSYDSGSSYSSSSYDSGSSGGGYDSGGSCDSGGGCCGGGD